MAKSDTSGAFLASHESVERLRAAGRLRPLFSRDPPCFFCGVAVAVGTVTTHCPMAADYYAAAAEFFGLRVPAEE
jgi:hypothetical protein